MREAEWSATAQNKQQELQSRSDRDEAASDEVGREMKVTVLSASPSILRIEGFLRADEVDALLARGRPRLQRSRVHGAGATAATDGVRRDTHVSARLHRAGVPVGRLRGVCSALTVRVR